MDLTRKLYVVEFSNTPADELGSSANPRRRAFDIATAALAAELVGGMQTDSRRYDRICQNAENSSVKPIGMFQAVQHQCADMYLENREFPFRSVLRRLGAGRKTPPMAATAVSIAKMYCSDGRPGPWATVASQIHGWHGLHLGKTIFTFITAGAKGHREKPHSATPTFSSRAASPQW